MTTAFGPFTLPLVREYQQALPDLDVRPIEASDSAAVVKAIEEGAADFGLAYADAVFSAYSGGSDDGGPSCLRGVSVLEPLPIYFLVRTKSGIHQASEIRGHHVAVPSKTVLSTWSLGDLLLRALDIDPATVETLPRDTLMTRLGDGSLDAVLVSGWTRSTASVFKAIEADVHLIDVEGAPIDRLRQRYPFIRSVTVPRVLYASQEHPLVTAAMDVLVISRRDLADAVVYRATKQLFQVYPKLSGVEATLRFLDPDEAPSTPIPLHPGAARYFRERELSR